MIVDGKSQEMRIREQIMARGSTRRIMTAALNSGLRLLRHDGWHKVRKGITTPEEVMRSTSG